MDVISKTENKLDFEVNNLLKKRKIPGKVKQTRNKAQQKNEKKLKFKKKRSNYKYVNISANQLISNSLWKKGRLDSKPSCK